MIKEGRGKIRDNYVREKEKEEEDEKYNDGRKLIVNFERSEGMTSKNNDVQLKKMRKV